MVIQAVAVWCVVDYQFIELLDHTLAGVLKSQFVDQRRLVFAGVTKNAETGGDMLKGFISINDFATIENNIHVISK